MLVKSIAGRLVDAVAASFIYGYLLQLQVMHVGLHLYPDHYSDSSASTIVFNLQVSLKLHIGVGHLGIIDYSFITVAMVRIVANRSFEQAADHNQVRDTAAGTSLAEDIGVTIVVGLRMQAVEQASTVRIMPVGSEEHCRVQLAGTDHNRFQMMQCQPCLIYSNLS